MIHFSERLAVAVEYEKWLKEHKNHIEDSPLSFLAFMQSRGLLNEKEFKKFCANYYLKEKSENAEA